MKNEYNNDIKEFSLYEDQFYDMIIILWRRF